MKSNVRLQKINYYDLQAPLASPSTPQSKIFIVFSIFTLKNCLYIINCQFNFITQALDKLKFWVTLKAVTIFFFGQPIFHLGNPTLGYLMFLRQMYM